MRLLLFYRSHNVTPAFVVYHALRSICPSPFLRCIQRVGIESDKSPSPWNATTLLLKGMVVHVCAWRRRLRFCPRCLPLRTRKPSQLSRGCMCPGRIAPIPCRRRQGFLDPFAWLVWFFCHFVSFVIALAGVVE